MLSWGMSWFSLVSIRQCFFYGTLVVKAITVYFWYGYSHGGFVGIWIDWNHGFVGLKSVLLVVVECLYAAMGLDIEPWCLKVLFISLGIVTIMVVLSSLLLIVVMR